MIKSNNKIIIIGTLPPPIGGVSIYNQRLYDYLQNEKEIEVEFIDYKRRSIFGVLIALFRHKIIFLNCSSSLFKFFLAIVSRMFNKKFLVNFHGNLERHSRAINLIDKFILKLATLTIVLNRQSFAYALKHTDKVFLGTAFIPPSAPEGLSPEIKNLLAECRKKYKVICSSNAHNVSIDKYGKEIYQVRFLLDLFREITDCCVLFSDPSGKYSKYLKRHKVDIPSNVFIIKETHSYFELLKETDVMLRITTTDGDSISVREALYLHKTVIASNVVARPAGVIVVSINKDIIKEQLRKVVNGQILPIIVKEENAGEQMVKIFKSL
jgi:hypothetical protein